MIIELVMEIVLASIVCIRKWLKSNQFKPHLILKFEIRNGGKKEV